MPIKEVQGIILFGIVIVFISLFLADLNILALEAESLNNSGVYVVGFIIKVQPNYSGASVNVAYTNPILCNGSGQIMNGSLDWLKSIQTVE